MRHQIQTFYTVNRNRNASGNIFTVSSSCPPADEAEGDKKKKDKKKKKGDKKEEEKEKKKGPSKATVKAMQEALAKMKEVGHCGNRGHGVEFGVCLLSDSNVLLSVGGGASQEGGGGAPEEAGGAGEAAGGAGTTPPPLASDRPHPSDAALTFDLLLCPNRSDWSWSARRRRSRRRRRGRSV